tara:strand:+ start:339 stop:536 length:198 start_codon:yes stop_codon:yes gene_type:complete
MKVWARMMVFALSLMMGVVLQVVEVHTEIAVAADVCIPLIIVGTPVLLGKLIVVAQRAIHARLPL